MDPNEETLSTTKYHKYPRNQHQMEEKVLQQVTKSTIKNLKIKLSVFSSTNIITCATLNTCNITKDSQKSITFSINSYSTEPNAQKHKKQP